MSGPIPAVWDQHQHARHLHAVVSPWSLHSLHACSVTVSGVSEGGWVFCGVERDALGVWTGPYTTIQGGSLRQLSVFSGDDCNVEFEVQHDGTATGIEIVYNTRAD